MNFPVVLMLLGHVIKYEMLLLFIPLFVSIYYGQGDTKAFIITILIMLPIYLLLISIKIKNKKF